MSKRGDEAPGQQKTFEVRNPATGETRTVTQRQWREEKLGQQGYEKPADLQEEDVPGGGTEGTEAP